MNEQKAKLIQDLESAQSSSLDTNSEVSKLSNELRTKQEAFESFQSEAETGKLNLQRRVDELERQNGLVDQQCEKLKGEMEALQTQKIESENQLNQELQNIKQSSDEEKAELQKELSQMRSTFEAEKLLLTREKQTIQEAFEKCQEELESKIKDLESSITGLESELEGSRQLSRQSESSMGNVVSDLKKKEAEVTAELEGQRHQTDELKKSLEQLEASKESLKNEYEEKLSLHRNKISKLEEDLVKVQDQQKLALAGTEEKVKIVDDMREKAYQQEKSITDFTHQLENERSMKANLEVKLEESATKLREMEDEQVDLVNLKEQLNAQSEELQQQIAEMTKLYDALNEKLVLERKDSEQFKGTADEKVRGMEEKINELESKISSGSQDKDVVVEKLHLREEEIVQLQAAMKTYEDKMKLEADDYHKLLQGKDEELLKTVHESATKDNLIADLKMNLENIQSCLNSTSSEKNLSVEAMEQLNAAVSERDFNIEELKLKFHSIEQINKQLEDQIKNMSQTAGKQANETELQIADLMEQLAIFEEVKAKEVLELNMKCSQIHSQLSLYENATESSATSLKSSQGRETELLAKVEEMEYETTKLKYLNQSYESRIAELEEMKGVPRVGDAYNKEMDAHIEFLNSIITDMHKKNAELVQQVKVLGTPAASGDATG